MKFDREILDAHAQFGGDLEDMQRRYDHARLTELDKDEFRDVAHIIDPRLTDEEFERAWAEFVELKRKRSVN